MKFTIIFLLAFILCPYLFAQELEQSKWYSINLGYVDNDSCIYKLQNEAGIIPVDPKAYVEIDVRDQSKEIVRILGRTYPLVSFSPKLQTSIRKLPEYAKQPLDFYVTYTSIFTNVIKKIKLRDVISEPKNDQNTQFPLRNFVNSYFTLFGGERLGIPLQIENGIGISFGIGSPYSGALETNHYEVNFHVLGGSVGLFNSFGDITDFTKSNNHNNIYTTLGFQANYIFPLSNILEFQYQRVINELSQSYKNSIIEKTVMVNSDGSKFQPKFITGEYVNFEIRYPIQLFNSQRGKVYIARYQREMFLGFKFYEMTIANNIFDFRVDYMFSSTERNTQINTDLLVSKIFSGFGSRNFAFGPSLSFSKIKDNRFGLLKAFLNLRVKLSDI
ncbi:MAG: hypothetical protein Q8940_01800 [Bacteroidota bacterium]|nr:hypothetical protein [Bacteroidota bacterium]